MSDTISRAPHDDRGPQRHTVLGSDWRGHAIIASISALVILLLLAALRARVASGQIDGAWSGLWLAYLQSWLVLPTVTTVLAIVCAARDRPRRAPAGTAVSEGALGVPRRALHRAEKAELK